MSDTNKGPKDLRMQIEEGHTYAKATNHLLEKCREECAINTVSVPEGNNATRPIGDNCVATDAAFSKARDEAISKGEVPPAFTCDCVYVRFKMFNLNINRFK